MQMRGGGALRPFFVLFLGIFFYFLFFIFTVFGVFFVLGANGPGWEPPPPLKSRGAGPKGGGGAAGPRPLREGGLNDTN